MEFNEKVGQNINYYRKSIGKTLKQVAHEVGITEATMQKYEAGRINRVDVSMVMKIATALETTPENICGWNQVDYHIHSTKYGNVTVETLSNLSPTENMEPYIEELDAYIEHQKDLSKSKRVHLLEYYKYLKEQSNIPLILSDEETELIKKYRKCTSEWKDVITQTLNTAYKNSKKGNMNE